MAEQPRDAKAVVHVKTSDMEAAIRGGRLEDLLSGLVNLNEVGVFVHPNCPICNSLVRFRAEKKWLESRNADSIMEFFIDHGEEYSVPIIKHHMERHLSASQEDIRKREWIDKVVNIQKAGSTTLDNLDLALAAISERMVSISALEDIEEPLSKVEKIKSDALCNLTSKMHSLLQLRAKMLGEMLGSGEMLAINTSDFTKMFEELLNEARSVEEKQIIDRVFGRFVKYFQTQ